MRILLLHSDYVKVEVKKKAIKDADEASEGQTQHAENVLVAFMAVEKADEENPSSVAEKTASDLKKTAKEVGASSVAIYPYAHLSSSLSSPSVARKVLSEVYDRVKDDLNAVKVPFGWYKGFELRCKGHPLSELSRTITPSAEGEKKEEQKESAALKAEEKLKSAWYVLDVDGSLTPAAEYKFTDKTDNLKRFTNYETSKVRAVDREPPHVSLMRSQEIADYEPGSDQGNMRWYPKGSLIKRLLEERVSSIVAENGGMQVETPIMYDIGHPQLSKYLNRFPARQYRLKSGDKEYFLRFAACFGQYLMKHDMTMSYKNLPLRLYELSHYSFRYEQSGELVGLRRLRSFTMPDMHTLVLNMDAAKEEFLKQYKLCMSWMKDINVDYEIGIRFVRSFYEENKDFAAELARLAGRPVLIEMWDERPFYFVMKFEFNFVDALDKASALSTVQIDIENAERFDIRYFDEEGKEKHPLLLHASISGSIDRNVYALLETAHMRGMKGQKPSLPLWLAPTQARIVSVKEDYNVFAGEIADRLQKACIRADVDDRNETIGKKIREAEKEWCPYILVVGENEKSSGRFKVRIRGEEQQREMSLEELMDEINKKTEGLPKKPLALPRKVSERPRFV